LIDHLRSTFAPTSATRFDRLFEEVCAASLLVLDDLRMQSITPWAREKLYQLIDERYEAALPTVITTDEDLERWDARLRSRFLDTRLCRILGISVPCYTGLGSKPVTRSRASSKIKQEI